MAETISLKKRLIGKEDINFDITGTNEQENFFTSDGGTRQLSKLNASHIPLLQETRGKLNAVNVDDALQILSDKVDNFEASDVLGEDLTISFLPEDDNETIQLKINQQKKNLNGHTLTFLFPSSLQQKLYTTFEWKDFFNGTVVISGGREDNRIAVYDNLDINSLFRIQRCQCEVIIRYFYFVHQHSSFAISAESSSAVIVDNCLFSGISGVDSYAVNKSASNVMLLDCELSEDIEFFPPEKDDGIGKYLGEIFAYPGAIPPEGAYLLNGQTITNCREFYQKFWEWLTDNANNEAIRSVTVTQYEEEIAQYGICSGFVISENDVRLPLWKGYQTPMGDSVPVVGNGIALGLTNGSNFGSPVDAASDYNFAPNGYGVAVGSSVSPARIGTNTAVGVTTDPEKSGLIADTSGYAKDGLYWCIQVYNAATALSEQESAQLASQMQMKAQTDFGNVAENLDFVVESWNDTVGNWYRKYRSGWVEQGGYIAPQSVNWLKTITLFKPFGNDVYSVSTAMIEPSHASGARYIRIVTTTKTSIEIEGSYTATSNTIGCFWHACGQGATE